MNLDAFSKGTVQLLKPNAFLSCLFLKEFTYVVLFSASSLVLTWQQSLNRLRNEKRRRQGEN